MGLDVVEIGMGSDLSLDLTHFAASKAVRQTANVPASDVDAYIRRLQEEQGKIEVFKRELPICASLLADVIDVVKELSEKKKNDRKEEEDRAAGDKSQWMSTAQLWTGGSVLDAAEAEKQDKSRVSAFTPFKAVGSGSSAFGRPCRRTDVKAVDVGMALSPLAIKIGPAALGAADESRHQVVGLAQPAARAAAMAPSGPALSLQRQPQQQHRQQQQQARKSRRCWSPLLHNKFIGALSQLGGPQVATPKQIRELMEVEGLTNDEVKSHLQKYRLHNRRAPGSAVASQPIMLVGGGLWIPQEQSSSQQSGSLQGPLRLSTSGVAGSSTATASCDGEDGRSASYGWR